MEYDAGGEHKPGKALRQLSQAVQRVEVGALPVAGQRFAVQLDAINGLQTGDIKIAAVNAERVNVSKPPCDCKSPGSGQYVAGKMPKVLPPPLHSDFNYMFSISTVCTTRVYMSTCV